jgi:peptidoglycan hydrolase-like protein with peptidoglycan-binding domain
VTRPNGSALQSDNLKASLVLPMGRLGPAFLAYDNFHAYLKWNASLMYSLTAAYYATRLDGAPAMYRGTPNSPKLTIDENRELQSLLQRRGYDVGRIDGVLGLKTRAAIREMQIKLGMPADSWPTPELLQQLRGGATARSL